MAQDRTRSREMEAATDGGETEEQEIRSHRDVRESDEKVRDITNPDGKLYAYREGDEHVVVARGNEPPMQWTKRVRAERTAVVPGLKLWTIPSNWNHRATIERPSNRRYNIYRIPETGVDVLVTIPVKNRLVEKWFYVKRIGQIEVSYDDSFDWGELELAIGFAHGSDEVSESVTEALKTLSNRREEIEADFTKGVEMYAEEAVFDRNQDIPPTIGGWTIEPWRDNFEFKPTIKHVLDIDKETLDGVLATLSNYTVHPNYPELRVDVIEDEGLPEQFYLRGLIQAGCSPAEALDYLMVERVGLGQTEWADERGKTQPSVSKNVSSAKRELEA